MRLQDQWSSGISIATCNPAGFRVEARKLGMFPIIIINFCLHFFAGDIAFRFLNYVKSQKQSKTATSTDSHFDIEIPKNIQTSAYVDPSEETSSSESSESSDDSELLGNRSTSCHVTVCDINQSMLDVGKGRAAAAGITSGIFKKRTKKKLSSCKSNDDI